MNTCHKDDFIFDVITSVDYRNGRNIFVLADGILVGVVSQGDLVKLLARRVDPAKTKVHEIMNLNPLVIPVSKKDDISSIKQLMASSKISELPVLDSGGRPVGIVQVFDLIRS